LKLRPGRGKLRCAALVSANGHRVAVVGEDVGRFAARVREEAGVGGKTLGDFVFVGDAAFEQAHRRAG